ncbi:MAG: SusC/RagA family TonB-linked outer membrane protein, partial [Bacteroidales bacterium]|nr:SusC/RagA family TonB-linked outer membrane protein [Bacteroidales bacterium]
MEKKMLNSRWLRVLSLIGALILMSFSVSAQTITGKITDENGTGLVGANIIVKGTTNGTISDFNGDYSLKINEGAKTLVVSMIGYTTKEIEIGDQTTINLQMELNEESLDEVVVVGYGTMKRSDMTGSVVSINEAELKIPVVSSFDQALTGRAAGVLVTQNSGQPGGGVSVKIRGTGSFSNNEPLYVVDGVPMSGNSQGVGQGFDWGGGGNGQTAINGLSGINPNDIVSIEVLKDASATAIYGSRASNGVVLITTKTGQTGKTNISYDGYFGLQTMPKRLDVLNLREFAEYNNDSKRANGGQLDPYFQDPSLLGEGTDWQNEVFRVSPVHNHNISITGGTEKTRFATSLGYMNQEGIIVGSYFDRITGRLNLDHNATSWLKFGVSMNISNTNERITLNDDDAGIVALALTQSPSVPVKYPDGSWGGPSNNEQYLENPVAKASLR